MALLQISEPVIYQHFVVFNATNGARNGARGALARPPATHHYSGGGVRGGGFPLPYQRFHALIEPTSLPNLENKIVKVSKPICSPFYDIDLVVETFTCSVCISKVKVV